MQKTKIILVVSLFLLLQGCYTTIFGGKTQENEFFNMEPESTKSVKRHFGLFGFMSYDSKTVNVKNMCGGRNPKSFGTMHSGVDIIIDVIGSIVTFGLFPLFYSQTTVFVQC